MAQSKAKALGWYLKAARKGDADAMHNVAYFYANGIAVRQNAAAADRWYAKAERANRKTTGPR